MYVSELQPGMLLELEPGFKYYLQESRKSKIPRLRIAPDVIVGIVTKQEVQDTQDPIMYLGETSNHIKNKNEGSRSRLRTVMVNGQVAHVLGREFGKILPISSGSFEGGI